MTRWELRLGLDSRFILDYWPDLFDSPACKVTRKEDGYYLIACRLENLDNNEVLESAKKLIAMMTAFAKIDLDTEFQSIGHDDEEDFISSSHEHIDGKNVYRVFPKANTSSISVCKATAVIQDKDGNIVPKERRERWYDYYLDRCDDWIDNTVVFKTLSYFAEKTTPRTLRLTYETIRNDEGGKDQILNNNDWATRDKLSDFTRSINHPDMEGQELHAKKASSNNNCNPKMNLAEARSFLAEILLKPWLIKKRERYKLAEGHTQAKYLANVLGF